IGMFSDSTAALVTIKVAMLDVGSDPLLLQPCIVALAAITCVCGNGIGTQVILTTILFNGFFKCMGLARVLMKAVMKDILIVGTDLQIVGWLKLAITHMIFLHPHEGSVRIGLAVAAPLAEHLLLTTVTVQCRWPVLTGISQLLADFAINRFVF